MIPKSVKKCSCGGDQTLIFPCSGGSNVGQVANDAALELTRAGTGAMYCLAGISGNVSGIVESTKSACKVVSIDGCKVQCAHKALTRAGRQPDLAIIVTELGIQKGGSLDVDAKDVQKVVKEVQSKL